MAWKGVHLSRPAYLSVKNRNLQITFRKQDHPTDKGEVVNLPLEDLDYLIVDTAEASLSAPLLAELAKSSVLVLGVDEKHMPAWASMPWAAYYKQGDVLPLQINSSQPLKKQIWAHIVRKKIAHQGDCLTACGQARAGALLHRMLPKILSGDTNNTEARAARVFWAALFPNRAFVRHADDLPNAMLNYGYALLRAALARNLCAIGFIPQLGIHHCGASNAFNLADDLIEPYRPLVDALAFNLLGDSSSKDPFTVAHRRAMTQVLTLKVTLCDEEVTLTTAMERTATGLKHALLVKDPARLIFPDFPRNLSE